MNKHRYGWKRDLPDHRDKVYSGIYDGALPALVDLRPKCPPIYDQGQLGSCTANAIGAAHQFDQMKENKPDIFMPSRLFLYFNERQVEGTIKSDAGASIRDGVKSIGQKGICTEQVWPYIIERFDQRPPTLCYTQAVAHKAVNYQRVAQSLDAIRIVLASGNPVVFGFSVFESFESPETARTGIVQMPGQHEPTVGGHAVLAVGYDDDNQRFIVRNSWGDGWGISGYFFMPYLYLTNPGLASDFWVIKTVL